MLVTFVLAGLTALSLSLLLWQWWVAARFPLHGWSMPSSSACPSISVLKPLKGCDDETEECLRSWFQQTYPGAFELRFGVGTSDDPAVPIVQRLCQQYPAVPAILQVCGVPAAANPKVAKLAVLAGAATHRLLVISDADVFAPPTLLSELAVRLGNPKAGLVSCFYSVRAPVRTAAQIEAIAINLDFWSQVLQSMSLKPLDFALGAVMATDKQALDEAGGFEALKHCLADDFQLGNRIAKTGRRLEIASTVVECRGQLQSWREVWRHQLRWARTIRVCRPIPYFLSVLSNAAFWPLLWIIVRPGPTPVLAAAALWGVRMLMARDLYPRLTGTPLPLRWLPMVLIKDLFQLCVWAAAFGGNVVEWRGELMRLRCDGTLSPITPGANN